MTAWWGMSGVGRRFFPCLLCGDSPEEQMSVADVPLLSLLNPSSQHLMTSPTPASHGIKSL